jgi:hypothetical protein
MMMYYLFGADIAFGGATAAGGNPRECSDFLGSISRETKINSPIKILGLD